MPGTGRFAPSPSGELHLGNLRTAALAWLLARSSGRAFLLRIEDLDQQRSSPQHARRQIADLAALGLDWDGEPLWQSTRLPAYRTALSGLVAAGETFECYCSRKEIRQAQSAPHAGSGRYPGTCRTLTAADRAQRRDAGRPATIRLRGGDVERRWTDLVHGPQSGVVDDVVLQRWDGALAYNLAVVVDDLQQRVDQVVRGDDLIEQTATQLRLIELLGGAAPQYAHVPLVVNPRGDRLAKRDGAVSMTGLRAAGWTTCEVRRLLLRSLEPAVPAGVDTLAAAARGFDVARLPRAPWVFSPPDGC